MIPTASASSGLGLHTEAMVPGYTVSLSHREGEQADSCGGLGCAPLKELWRSLRVGGVLFLTAVTGMSQHM